MGLARMPKWTVVAHYNRTKEDLERLGARACPGHRRIQAVKAHPAVPARRARRRPRHLDPTGRDRPDLDRDLKHKHGLQRLALSAHDPRTPTTSRGSTMSTTPPASPLPPPLATTQPPFLAMKAGGWANLDMVSKVYGHLWPPDVVELGREVGALDWAALDRSGRSEAVPSSCPSSAHRRAASVTPCRPTTVMWGFVWGWSPDGRVLRAAE